MGIPQLSVAEMDAVFTTGIRDEQDTVTSSGFEIITGFSMSRTVTVKEQVAIFPDSSVAVTTTGVVPIGKALPPTKEALLAPPL